MMKQISQFTMLNLMNVHLKWLDKRIATTWVSSRQQNSKNIGLKLVFLNVIWQN